MSRPAARRFPRRLGDALGRAREDAAPATLLAGVQQAWPQVAGAAVAREAGPVSEREGVVTIACRSATWAQELDLLAPQLLERLNLALEAKAAARGAAEPGLRVARLRFTADAARHE